MTYIFTSVLNYAGMKDTIDYQVDISNSSITAKEHKNLSETLVDSRESQWSGTN